MVAKVVDLNYLPDWPRLLSREQAAAYCSVSPTAFDQHFAPYLSSISFGRSIRYDRSKLDRYVETLANEDHASPLKALDAL